MVFILKELKTKYILERTKFLNIDEWTKEYKLNDLFKDLSFQKPNNKEIQGSLVNLFYGGAVFPIKISPPRIITPSNFKFHI